MARQDIAGLLTGISSGRPDPMAMGSNSAQQRLAFGAQRGQNLQRGVRGMMGGNTMTNAEQLQMAMAQLDLSNPADLAKLAQIQQATGDLAGAAQTASKMKAMQQAKIDETRAVAREKRASETFTLGKEDRDAGKIRDAANEKRAIAQEKRQDRSLVLREEQAARQKIADGLTLSDRDKRLAEEESRRTMYENDALDKGKPKLAAYIKEGMPLATVERLLFKTSTAKIDGLNKDERNAYKVILDTPVMQDLITKDLEEMEDGSIFGFSLGKLSDKQEDAVLLKTKEIATREQISIEEAMPKAIKILTGLQKSALTPAQIEAAKKAAEANAALNSGPPDDDSDKDSFGNIKK